MTKNWEVLNSETQKDKEVFADKQDVRDTHPKVGKTSGLVLFLQGIAFFSSQGLSREGEEGDCCSSRAFPETLYRF